MAGARPPSGGFVFSPEAPIPARTGDFEFYRDARAELVDAAYVASREHADRQWRAMRIGAHSEIVDFTRLFVAKMASYSIPVYPHEFVRSAEKQRQLYADGFSKALPEKAPHCWGMAVDIVHSHLNWALTPKQWEFFGAIGKELAIQRGISITWGGDWPPIREKVGWDPAHWQLTGWRSQMTGFPFMPVNRGSARSDVR